MKIYLLRDGQAAPRGPGANPLERLTSSKSRAPRREESEAVPRGNDALDRAPGPKAELSVLIGTYNRLDLLRQSLAGILRGTDLGVRVYVADAGSTDGTVEYLAQLAEREPRVRPILAGRKLGQARALNEIIDLIETEFVCWLSDDNVVVRGALDIAVDILKTEPKLGLVALKVKDVVGPYVDDPYIGGISSVGVLNVNQGVIRASILRELGGFSEEYQDYGIDPDLTARVLFSGWRIAYTREVAVHHHREWVANPDPGDIERRLARQERSLTLYRRRFEAVGDPWTRLSHRAKCFVFHGSRIVWHHLKGKTAVGQRICLRFARFTLNRWTALAPRQLSARSWALRCDELLCRDAVPADPNTSRPASVTIPTQRPGGSFRLLGYNARDWSNVFLCRYISLFDPLRFRGRPYHLVQSARPNHSVGRHWREQTEGAP